MSWQKKYIERFYSSNPNWIDGNQEFQRLIAKYIRPGSDVIEIGPGEEGSLTTKFLTVDMKCRVTGIDTDPACVRNPYLADTIVYDGDHMPLSDSTFDSAVADYVLEHVERPSALMREVNRILKPGGTFCFRTPNKWHYVSLMSRCMPSRCSRWARNKRPHHRLYKKYFRCNTARTCMKHFSAAGLSVAELYFIEKEPSYGMASRTLFLLMFFYERAVNRTGLLASLRANILGCAIKNTA